MVGGKDMEMHVMQILQKEVIQKLEHHKTVNLSSQLLHGLQELVHKSGETKMLKELFKTCLKIFQSSKINV
jgi:hypothetical protein